MPRGWSMVVLASALTLVGCKDGSGEAEFAPQSVPPNKPVDELDPMEQMEFCEEAIAWAKDFLADDLRRVRCRVEASRPARG